MPKMVYWAIEYSKIGWSVIPLIPGGKKPPIPWKEFQDRRADETEIREWWIRYPSACVGLITGMISDVDCLDFDGERAFDLYEANVGEFQETITQTTGRSDGGFHALYKYHGGGLKSKKI